VNKRKEMRSRIETNIREKMRGLNEDKWKRMVIERRPG
jgi:hypothetical protein